MYQHYSKEFYIFTSLNGFKKKIPKNSQILPSKKKEKKLLTWFAVFVSREKNIVINCI